MTTPQFDFGSLLVEANSSQSCYAGFEATELGFYISYSQLIGTGGPFAQISLGAPMYYDLVGVTKLLFGTTADLEFATPSNGTITFDAVSPLETSGELSRKKAGPHAGSSDGSYSFTVVSANAADGGFAFTFTIEFPDCPVTVQGKYR